MKFIYKILKFFRVLIIGKGGKRVSKLLKIYLFFRNYDVIWISHLILIYIERTYGLYIDIDTIFGKNIKFPHPSSIVIGKGVRIGDEVRIYQNVTIGGAKIGDGKKSNYPTIGSGTIIFAGAVLIGDITIGENCIIGANAVVNKDVPSDHIAVGVPCRILKK